ncbi:MAG: hypothetical protein ACSW8D_05850, partial [Prevotella sp.]
SLIRFLAHDLIGFSLLIIFVNNDNDDTKQAGFSCSVMRNRRNLQQPSIAHFLEREREREREREFMR